MPVNNRKPPAKMMEEALRCYELQNMGLSTYQIAEEMGFSQKTVRNRIDLAIKGRKHPKIDEYRQQQIDRCHYYLKALRKQIEAGDPKSIAQAIRTEERLARLMGYDAATQFVVTNKDEELPADHPLRLMMASAEKAKEADRQEDIERAAAGLPALPSAFRERRRAKELEALEKMDRDFQERTGIEPPKRVPDISETDISKPKAIAPLADEFAKDNTFAPHEVQPEAIRIADDIEEPAPRPRRRGKPIPNPALQFLRDSDDD